VSLSLLSDKNWPMMLLSISSVVALPGLYLREAGGCTPHFMGLYGCEAACGSSSFLDVEDFSFLKIHT